MGQKVNPVGFRLGITRTWDSRWYENRQYRDWLHEDLRMRKLVDGLSRSAAVSKMEIERRANQIRVVISTAKPGIIIGKRGAGIEDLKKKLEKVSGKQVNVNVLEIKHPELDAKLVANNIVDQLEKRIAFRRAMRQAIQRTIKSGAKGIKVQVGGRLGGAEIARVERNFEGKVPLHTLRANIDYAHSEAYTTFGRIGVKVWVYLGEVLPDGKPKVDAAATARPTRLPTRTRTPRAAKPGEAAPSSAAQPADAAAATIPDASQAANVPVVEGQAPLATPEAAQTPAVAESTGSIALEEPAGPRAVEEKAPAEGAQPESETPPKTEGSK